MLKEGLYEDFERRSQLLGLARFKTTAGSGGWRSIKDYADSIKHNQTAIYYATGTDLGRLESSPQLEGFRARAASRCCSCLIPSTASGLQPALITKESRLSR